MRARHLRHLLPAALTAAVLLLGAANAWAGSYSVSYSNGSGCGIYKALGTTADFNTWVCNSTPMGFGTRKSSIPHGTRVKLQATAPSGLAITAARVSPAVLIDVNDKNQWGGGSYYHGGSSAWSTGDISEQNSNLSSSYWGFQLVCRHSPSCTDQAAMSVNSIALTVSEARGPTITPTGTANLWNQAATWVWNAPGSPWSIAFSGTDPSGVCALYAIANGTELAGPTQSRDTNAWQQCPDWTWNGVLDTSDYVPTSGTLALTLAGQNAAHVATTETKTVEVDNDPVTVSLSTPNDPDPTQWVSHPVTVDAAPSTGPSGVGGMDCSLDGATAVPYPAGGVSVNGDGTHTITCTAWNTAINPAGNHASGSATEQIKIDQAAPSVQFEPVNPTNPDQVVLDTSDSESGVAGGHIQIAPAGTNDWTSLATSFDGQHLLATINDAGLTGPYTVKASSCDRVDNCASTTETLTMPLRLNAASDVSFKAIKTPAKVVTKNVLVDYHYKRERRGKKIVAVKAGGHYEKVKLVIHANRHCAQKRVKTGRHRWTEIDVCRKMKLRIIDSRTVAHGKPATIHGLLITKQGVPIPHAPVRILTAPENGLRHFTTAGATTTNRRGVWTIKLPAGASRIIHADYAGSPTTLPSVGTATVKVPARIRLSITPRVLPWSGVITLRGRLQGGHVPPDGVALRLLVRYPGSKLPSPLLALRTNNKGAFTIHWSYHAGIGVATYPFSVATTATESDYPYTAASSRQIKVTFGRPTPRSSHR